jgi:phage/plasmid-associated DNA primase
VTDQVARFIEEKCEMETGFWTPSQDIFEAYNAWAKRKGVNDILTMTTFCKRLKDLGATHKRSTGGVNGYRLKIIE